MSTVKGLPNVSTVAKWEELRRFTAVAFDRLLRQVNGGLNFGQNIFASGPNTVEFSGSGDIVKVPHSLKKVPDGFIVINLTTAIILYKASAPEWSASDIYLSANGAGIATIWVL